MAANLQAVAAVLAVMPVDDIGETLIGWRTTDALGYVPGDVGYSADDPPEQGSVWGAPEPLARRYAAAVRAVVAEEIARAIEVERGERCPECGGKPASSKWVQFKRHGRCGAGHTWVADHAEGQWRSMAEIARAHAVEPVTETEADA